ncbi:MAG: glycosyltransferase family A protein, partial [Bacteroidia bacterium]
MHRTFNRAAIEVSEVLIAGTARNVERYIKSDIDCLKNSFSDFKKIYFLIIESDSTDATLQKLAQLKLDNDSFDYISLGQLSNTLKKRTERIAFCRNKVIDTLLSN